MRRIIHNKFYPYKEWTERKKDAQKVEDLINKGNYIVKELEALYSLKKYRTLKRRYYDTEEAVRHRHRYCGWDAVDIHAEGEDCGDGDDNGDGAYDDNKCLHDYCCQRTKESLH